MRKHQDKDIHQSHVDDEEASSDEDNYDVDDESVEATPMITAS